ncbi:threonine synthase [Striga asiatica]|uniref:Threonine synthase n=1 Tax=Striga asiatica TaxID=4170 RepID=A0A5A7QV31_STRAF|nr:threonine synthase [Striga asiatica]
MKQVVDPPLLAVNLLLQPRPVALDPRRRRFGDQFLLLGRQLEEFSTGVLQPRDDVIRYAVVDHLEHPPILAHCLNQPHDLALVSAADVDHRDLEDHATHGGLRWLLGGGPDELRRDCVLVLELRGDSATSSDPLSAAASASASLKHRRPTGENIRDEVCCHAWPHGFSAKYVPFNADPFSTDSYSLDEIVYKPSPRHLQYMFREIVLPVILRFSLFLNVPRTCSS